MVFEYQVYLRQTGIVPLVLLLFCLIGLVYLAYFIFSHAPYENLISFLTVNLKVFLAIPILFCLISANLIPLVRGGIWLLFEKEQDCVVIQGTIDDTMEMSWFGGAKYGSIYGYENNSGYGEGLEINGIKYYIASYGSFKKGDYVKIKVLPKSKYILEIDFAFDGNNSSD